MIETRSGRPGALRHYGTDSLVARMAEALRGAKLAESRLPQPALAPLDQFHVGGQGTSADFAGCGLDWTSMLGFNAC